MSLVVEDGTGKDDAESYISAEDADTYHENHGDASGWSGATIDQKEGALRAATVWLDGKYRWKGVVLNDTQALGWPRVGAYDRDGRLQPEDAVPQRVIDACAHLALYHLQSAIDVTLERGGQVVEEQVGPVKVRYRDFAPGGTEMPYLRALLRGLYKGGTSSVDMIRA